ncbi:hypothetical protein [Alteraurantiacibacter palmitatis]|uniref:Uncharacterized protein n=1 Tax=Alteraurantiacibacter palmitatis TaxID=2054628 RepID=A0ABV7E765_9SPHN
MKTSVTHLQTSGGKAAIAACVIGALLASSPAAAQRRPVTDPDASVRDVAMTPLSDLNISRDPIPDILLAARAEPYSRRGIAGCDDILRAVAGLDAILGQDFDIVAPEERGVSVTNLAQRVIGSFIPFRGIIREISGANAHEFEFREAIAAGLMRRAYLKGIGQEMACPYPASPATPEMVARLRAAPAKAEAPPPQPVASAEGFYSSPVVQDIN